MRGGEGEKARGGIDRMHEPGAATAPYSYSSAAAAMRRERSVREAAWRGVAVCVDKGVVWGERTRRRGRDGERFPIDLPRDARDAGLAVSTERLEAAGSGARKANVGVASMARRRTARRRRGMVMMVA